MTNAEDRLRALQAQVKQEAIDEEKRELERLEQERGKPTPTEVVSVTEIYALREEDKNGRPALVRYRRICGAPLSAKRKEYRCLNVAGLGTNHLGYGRCHYCDLRAAQFNPARLLKNLGDQGLALKLKEVYELVPELMSEDDITKLDEEILIARGLLMEALNVNAVDTALGILDLLGKLKLQRSKIETDKLVIDKGSIELFVSSILRVLKESLGPTEYSEVMLKIQKVLALPINKPMQKALEVRSGNATIVNDAD